MTTNCTIVRTCFRAIHRKIGNGYTASSSSSIAKKKMAFADHSKGSIEGLHLPVVIGNGGLGLAARLLYCAARLL